MSDHEDVPPPPYPGETPSPAHPADAAPPVHPGEAAPLHPEDPPPAYPGEVVPAHPGDPLPAYPGDAPPAYPEDAAPGYPGEAVPAYPGDPLPVYPEDAPPGYPGEMPAPAYTAGSAAPAYPGAAPPASPADALPGLPAEAPPAYPGEVSPPTYPGGVVPAPRAGDDWELAPPLPPPPPVSAPLADHADPDDHDDLALEHGRRMVKSVQRTIDGAALSHLLVTVPLGLISLAVVAALSGLFVPVLGLIVPVAWLLSGPLVFHRDVESAIARRLLGMRRPTPEEAQRLELVWEQVIRRAGVDRGTYELWIQERTELNATAAAGHIVAVTRHAMERLPNSRLGAVLAHELGHHVGGHTWAAMLADWYALPARAAGRAILALLFLLFRTKHWAGVACGGCLSLMIVQFLFLYTFVEGMWWLVLPVAAAPVLIAWLHRRAEFRADAYAVGLGFGEALEDVLMTEAEAQARAAAVPGVPPGVPPFPQQYPAQPYAPQPYAGQPSPPQQYPGQPYPGQQYPAQPYPPQPYPGQPYAAHPYPPQQYPAPPDPEPARSAGVGRHVARAAHTNTDARLRNVRLVMSQQVQRSAPAP